MNRTTCAAVAASLTLAGVAQAQTWPTHDPSFSGPPVSIMPTAERFAQPGSLVIASDFALNFQYASVKPPVGEAVGATTIRIGPAIDYFIARNVAVGARLGFLYSKPTNIDIRTTAFSLAPEVGYSLPLSPRVSLFPRLGVGYRTQSVSSPNPLGGRTSSSAWAVNVFVLAPVLFHPFEHFFLGGGPSISYDVAVKDGFSKTTQIDLAFVIGGWF